MLGRVKVKRILKLKFVCTLVYCSHRHTLTHALIHTRTLAHRHTLSNWHKFSSIQFSLSLSLSYGLLLSVTPALKQIKKKRSSNFVDVFSCFKTFCLNRFFNSLRHRHFIWIYKKKTKQKNNIYYILKKQQKVFVVAKRNKTKKWYIYINIYCIHLSIYTFVYTCIFSMPTTYVICRDFEFFQVKTPQSKYSSALPQN